MIYKVDLFKQYEVVYVIHCAGAGCDTLNNCAVDADCLYDSYTQEHRCQCRSGFKGDGYFCEEEQV